MRRLAWLVVCFMMSSKALANVSDLQLKLPFPNDEQWKIDRAYNEYPTHVEHDIYALDFNYIDGGNSDLGRPILAAANGTVVAVQCDSEVKMVEQKRGYGCRVTLSHLNNTYHTLYAHLHTITVYKNQAVVRGQQIGLCGNLGESTAAHLHFVLYPVVNGVEQTSVRPEPMDGYTNFVKYEHGVHDTDGDGKYRSSNVVASFVPVGYTCSPYGSNCELGDPGFVHEENSTSARIAEVHRIVALKSNDLALIPGDREGGGTFVHDWDGVSIQDFPSIQFEKNGAIIQKRVNGVLYTQALHAGFWDVYVGNNGPTHFGVPTTTEDQRPVPASLGCPGNTFITRATE